MPIRTIREFQNAGASERALARKTISKLGDRYESFLNNRTEPPREPGIHASEISVCLRKIVYSISTPRDNKRPSAFWRRKFELGHAVHSMVQAQFREMAGIPAHRIRFVDEVKIHPDKQRLAADFDIHSSTDGVFDLLDEWMEPEYRSILEIKTKSKDEYKKLREPEPEHVEQAHVYMACLDVPYTWFFYWDKDTHMYTHPTDVFLITFDQQLWDNIEDRMMHAYGYMREGSFPPREDGYHCEICAWSNTCQPKYLQPNEKSFARDKKVHLPTRKL